MQNERHILFLRVRLLFGLASAKPRSYTRANVKSVDGSMKTIDRVAPIAECLRVFTNTILNTLAR
jgi:hypothetical protein